MKVSLLHITPLSVCSHAIRTCYQSFANSDFGGKKDMGLIEKVSKAGHSSTLEHIVSTWYIQDMSRACLQELARHRMASLSVKSSRYTLGELKKENMFAKSDFERAKKYIRLTGDEYIDEYLVNELENLRSLVNLYPNDISKYAMPESYLTELTWTINARSLQNFFELRSDHRALAEIQELARHIWHTLPSEYRFLFKDFYYGN